jgi:hypothetical protein
MSEAKPKSDNRNLATGLAAGAAIALIYAAFTQQWLVNSGHYTEIGFGLTSNHECSISFGGGPGPAARACAELSNSEFIEKWRSMGSEAAKLTSSAFAPIGKVTLVVILLAASSLLAAAALSATRKQLELPIAPTTIALLAGMTGLITGCVFVATKPGPPGMVGVGLSFWIFGIGCVVGIVGAQLLAKINKPPDPEWTVD